MHRARASGSAKILVADDDADLLDIVAYALRRHSHEVVTAADGVRALEVFEREAPDLVILDVNMPGLDGLEVCRRIRERSATPIIMLTVRHEAVDVVGALRWSRRLRDQAVQHQPTRRARRGGAPARRAAGGAVAVRAAARFAAPRGRPTTDR